MQKIDLTDLSPIIPKKIKKLEASYITRYVITAELIKRIISGKKYEPLKILDIGGYNGALVDLLPEAQITVVDIQEDSNLKNYLKVTESKLPFKDNTFDFVISCDTLEHVKPGERDIFINEVIRVASEYIIIAAPFKSEASESEEAISNAFYQGMTGFGYTWLEEHRDYILPSKQWLERLIRKHKGIYYKSIDHTSIGLWGNMLRNSFFLPGNIGEVNSHIASSLVAFNDIYVNNFAFKDFPKEGYRTFYVISKINDIDIVLPKYDIKKHTEMTAEYMRLLGSSIQELTKQYGVMSKEIIELKVAKEEKEKIALELAGIKSHIIYRIYRKIRNLWNFNMNSM